MNKKYLYLSAAVAVVGAAVAIVAGLNGVPFAKSPPVEQNRGRAGSQPKQWETKTNNQSGVTIAVTPVDLSAQPGGWKFDIVMNTHSVALDQDLTKSAILIDDQGKEYKPISWDGPVGGHHREGTLAFNPIALPSRSIELKITGIADAVRVFTWQLNF